MTIARKTVGRKLTKRTLEEHIAVDGEVVHLVSLDHWGVFSAKAVVAMKNAAISALEQADVPATKILLENPGGSSLRDLVLNYMGYEPDSKEGLAARICESCIRIEQLPGMGAPIDMLMGEAFKLGQLMTIARAYGIDSDVAAKNASGRAGVLDPLRKAVIAVMQDARRQDRDFKSFMAAWVNDTTLDGLGAKLLASGKYQVTDLDSAEAEPPSKEYTWGSLKQMWSELGAPSAPKIYRLRCYR